MSVTTRARSEEREAPVRGDTSQRGIQSADRRRHDRISQPERLEDETGKPLNPVVAWSIVLLASLGLWWGLWRAVSLLL
jgi:hypothetical protein